MIKIIILPRAKSDIKKAAFWYNKQQRGLGKRLTSEIKKSVKFIAQNPTGYAIRYDKTRTIQIDIFPYLIHYTFIKGNNQILISAVFHTSRDPENWKKRKLK